MIEKKNYKKLYNLEIEKKTTTPLNKKNRKKHKTTQPYKIKFKNYINMYLEYEWLKRFIQLIYG